MSYALGFGSGGLGDASASVESELLLAVAQDVASGNLTESKINDYASKAGAAAAAGGCVAAGAGAAAPLCSYVGGKIGGAVAGMFTSGNKESLPDLQARLVANVVPLCEGDADCKYLLTWYANVLGRCLYSYQEALYIKPGVYGAGDPAMSELWSKITWTPSTPFFEAAPKYAAWIQNTVEPWFKRSVATVVAAAKLRREMKFLQSVVAYRNQLQKQYLPQCPASIPSCQTELYGIISQWAMATKAANERGLQLYAGRASYSDASYRAEVEGKLATYKAQQKAAVVQKSQADAANLRLGRQETATATSTSNTRKLVVAGLVVGAGIIGIFAIKKRG